MSTLGNNVNLPLIKLALAGNVAVGKTSIQMRYLLDEFEAQHRTTIGMEIQKKNVQVKGRKVKVEIWDSAGQERYESMTRQCFRGARGIILVFDVTEWESFSDLNKRWLPKIKEECPDACRLLIGNKSDLSNRAIKMEDITRFADENNFFYHEVSAKLGTNIEHAFEVFLVEVVEKHKLFEKPVVDDKKIVKLGGSARVTGVKGEEPLTLQPQPAPKEDTSCGC
jgi:small GTP-binding protein